MNLTILRIAILIEALCAATTVALSSRLLDWRIHEPIPSPDSPFLIEGLIWKCGISIGVTFGIAICLGLVAYGERAAFLTNRSVRVHLLAGTLPVLIVIYAAGRLW